MQAVILAGGRGTRLHPLTDQTPKPLTPLFNRPVMEHLIELLAKHEVRDITVTLSYLARDIVHHFGDGSKWGVNLHYSIENSPKGTAGGVKELQPILHDTFLVLSGDVVTDFDLTEAMEFHQSRSAIATVLLADVDDPMEFGVVSTTPDGQITRLVEKPKSEQVFSNTVSTGIYVMELEALSSIPYDQPYDFSRELIPRLLRNMEPVFGCKLNGYWCDIGNFVQYRNAHFDALTGKVDIAITGTEIEKGIWVGDNCEVHETAKLSAPLFLGDGAEVRRNVSVGCLSVVGDQALVDEGATVRRSIVGNGAFIGRASRITDCVVGNGSRVMDHGDFHNRVVTAAGMKAVRSELSEEDLPSIHIDRDATPLAA
jgi:mannose-1-phosphate guanylyltransferase / phosphomannomutase